MFPVAFDPKCTISLVCTLLPAITSPLTLTFPPLTLPVDTEPLVTLPVTLTLVPVITPPDVALAVTDPDTLITPPVSE